jgi:hypothetical protein
MAGWRRGTVSEITARRADLLTILVDVEDTTLTAVAFPHMVAEISEGDEVVLNTTGIDLGLGTGGVAFVLWNLTNPALPAPGEGHIVKLRYTPWQTEVLAAEAPESPHHEALKEVTSLDGTPVVVCGLHSQVAAATAGIKDANPEARVGYLMTDGAALPLAWSNLVRSLREAGLVDVTATSGHAFGGDLEAVNVFSALAALEVAGEADAIVVAMGPGVVGTDTSLGFTAMEQGPILDAAGALGGRAIACLRVSFLDERPRHAGLSHHCVTALQVGAQRRCTIALPELPQDQARVVADQLERSGLSRRHDIVSADGGGALRLAAEHGIALASMGRAHEEHPELFLAAGAAGGIAGRVTLEPRHDGTEGREKRT